MLYIKFINNCFVLNMKIIYNKMIIHSTRVMQTNKNFKKNYQHGSNIYTYPYNFHIVLYFKI